MCVSVMKHVGQHELRMSLQFTLQLCDSLWLSSGSLNKASLTRPDSSWLATNVNPACYAKKPNRDPLSLLYPQHTTLGYLSNLPLIISFFFSSFLYVTESRVTFFCHQHFFRNGEHHINFSVPLRYFSPTEHKGIVKDGCWWLTEIGCITCTNLNSSHYSPEKNMYPFEEFRQPLKNSLSVWKYISITWESIVENKSFQKSQLLTYNERLDMINGSGLNW